MPQKTVTVEHPGAHQASQEAYDEALIAAEIPDGYTVAHYVNESGVSTKYTLKWGDDAPEESADVEPPAEPKSRRKTS
jgi:hypothetical protein